MIMALGIWHKGLQGDYICCVLLHCYVTQNFILFDAIVHVMSAARIS
jgi:hypothetical protein